MMHLEPMFDWKTLPSMIGGLILGAILSQGPIFWAWIFLAGLDIASGLINARYLTKDINSDAARRGCVKKAQMFIMWLASLAIEQSFHFKIELPYLGLTTPSNFIAAMWVMTELISVVENAGKGGAKLPRWIETSFQKLKAGVDSGPSNLFNAQDRPIDPRPPVERVEVTIVPKENA